MAEIILPPEENEDIPQVPELNIDKPSGNSKVITIEFEAKKTNKVSTKDTNQQLYTTDTDAWFEFKETSLEGANGTYSVVFRNGRDGSIFQRTGDVVNGVAYYKIPHQEIRHAGAWRGQIVYTLSNGDTTSREFGYDVQGHILDGKDVREIIVENFETLMAQLRNMKDNAESELANLTQELRSINDIAEQNETDRQAFFDGLVEDVDDLQANYQELLDTGVLQTNINTKLEQLEEEYAPKLTEVTAQLAQNVINLDLFKKRESDIDDSERMQRAIDYCSEHNIPLNLNGGLYYVKGLTMPAGTTINGNGATFKKPDLTQPPYNMTPAQMKWVRLLVCDTYSGDEDSNMTTVEGITFDGNCWSMWDTPSYEQEQASLFYAHADSLKPGRLNLRITNCRFMNNVSDGVHVRNNVNLQIDNCSSFDCFRGGLVITGGYSNIVGTNLIFRSDRLNDGIDIEVDGHGYGNTYEISVILDNIIIDKDLDLGGGVNDNIVINNLIMNEEKGGFNMSIAEGGRLSITNSKIVGGVSTIDSNRLYFGGKVNFYNCDFICNVLPENVPENTVVDILTVGNYYRTGTDYYDNTVVFDTCTFDYLHERGNFSVRALRSPVNNTAKITVLNCIFSNKLNYAINGGWLKLYFDKNTVEVSGTGISVTGNTYTVGSHTIFGENDWGSVIRNYMMLDGIGITIEHLGSHIDASKTNASGSFLIDKKETTHASYFNYILGNRVLYVDSDPSSVTTIRGLVGDTAILKGTNQKWECIKSGSGANSWSLV